MKLKSAQLLAVAVTAAVVIGGCDRGAIPSSLNEGEESGGGFEAPLVWSNHLSRALNESERINARKILDVATRKGPTGKYRYKNVDELLEAPLFARYRNDSERRFQMTKVHMGVSRGLFAGAASPEHPRILHHVGTTSLAFYTDPEKPQAYNTLEIMETDPRTAEVEFYFLRYEDKKPEVVRNPASCRGCHQGRAIWQMYNIWPGMVRNGTREAPVRRMGRTSDIGFTIAQYEMNLARIARSLLENRAYRKVEKRVIAALIDCPTDRFSFAGKPEYKKLLKDTRRRYNQDLHKLANEFNRTVRKHDLDALPRDYERTDGKTTGLRVIVNRQDPVRLAKVKYLLQGSGVDVDRWSISRGPAGESLLFQSSGGISLSHLATYLVNNSPQAETLKALLPNVEELAYTISASPSRKMCEGLLD